MDGTNTHPVGAERAILGNLLLYGGQNHHAVEEILSSASWGSAQHANIWTWIGNQVRAGGPVHPTAIIESAGGPFVVNERYGGPEYLTSLPDRACLTNQLEATAVIVAGAAKVRKLQEECNRTLRLITEGQTPIDELIADAENRVLNVSIAGSKVSSVQSMKDVGRVARARAERIADGDVGVEYVPTYYPSFDSYYTGWPRGLPSYLGGRSKMGKTMFLLSTMLRGASPIWGGESIPQGLISMEMSGPKLMYRMASTMSGVPWSRLRNRNASDAERQRFFEAMDEVQELPIFIDDSVRSVDAVVSAVRRMARVNKCSVVGIDYLQLIKGGGKNAGETAGWDAICDELRAVAKQEDIALVVLSQLNQNCEKRTMGGRRGVPGAGDFRGTEKMLFDAGIAAAIYREFFYHPPRGMGGRIYTEEQLADCIQPVEFIAIGTREAARKNLELYVRMDVGQVFDPLDEGFQAPAWERKRR